MANVEVMLATMGHCDHQLMVPQVPEIWGLLLYKIDINGLVQERRNSIALVFLALTHLDIPLKILLN